VRGITLARIINAVFCGRRKLISIAIIAFMMGGAFGGVLWHFGGLYVEPFVNSWNLNPLQRFSSSEELNAFLNRSSKAYVYYRIQGGVLSNGMLPTFTESTTTDYSTTNIQVAGVDEADIVKNDGQYIYLVSGKSVVIVQAYPAEDAKILSRLDLNQTINGIFVENDRMVVFHTSSDIVPKALLDKLQPQNNKVWTTIKIYDISDRSFPVLKKEITVDGSYFTSRMIGDYVYAIVNQPVYIYNGKVDLPTISFDNNIMDVPASSIYYINASDYYYAFVKILAMNIQNTAEEPNYETLLLGSLSSVYVSQKNIYITLPGNDTTNIRKIGIEDNKIMYLANGTVPGRVLNQFSMDESNDYFRIATTKGWSTSATSNVYILNQQLSIVGKLEGLARGESIYSARFMGDRCYLVTFQKVDPLFVIDLKDPQNPQVLGKLKIPGYSNYLEPYDDTHLIGIGKEALTAEQGDFSWYQGVKIVLFDVSNVSEPKEIAEVVIGDRGTDSPVLRDSKALLFSRSRNLLVLPVLVAEIDPGKYPGGVPANAYGDYVWQGAYVFNISAETGITERGRITHLKSADLLKSGYYFDSPYSVKRALYIGDVLYTVSDKMIKLNSLDTLAEIGKVQLP
jgi:inhibitor of cysteine peptidase